jgi:thiosulfate dehydrogenase [quinone] large subunit
MPCPLAGLYHGIAGTPAVDALFMLGLLGVGLGLTLGVAMRAAVASGVAMLALMYTALLPPTTNPVLDDHVVYALALVALHFVHAGRTWGLGARWEQLGIVQRWPWLA